MSVTRFSVSLEKELLDALDEYVDANHFANRSQAIRNLVNKNLQLEVFAIKGIASRLTELSDLLISIKGMQNGKLTMSRAD